MKKLLLLLLCLPILSLSQQTTDLFISEYGEGSGYNKYIEIYNGTGTSVDLSDYQIWKITNGGSWPEYTLNLSGNLAYDDVYIIYHTSSNIDPIISSAGDVTWSQASWTGDDAVGLAKNGVLIDVIGEDGPDPGNGWDVAGITDATKDHTLVRKCSVTQGNTNWSLSAGTDALNSEWVVLSQNDWSDIGQHTFPCQSVSVYGCTDSTAINYNPLATIDDGSCVAVVLGCTNTSAANYDANANTDDGSCCFVSGCTDSLAFNYNAAACYDDGSCITPIFGCINTNAMNFDSTANTDDGSCIFLADKVDLFFSEYGEGSSNNKYLEIYNSTSNSVNLSSYAFTRVSNAPTTVGVYEYWVEFDSAAIILANDVYIVAHPSADSLVLAQADMTYSVLSNGDDGFALVYGEKPSSPVLAGNEYVILDFLGDFNGDPGSGWDVAGVSEATKDHVLIRKCDINIGNTNWTSSAGTDSLNSEWIVLANEDWSDIGQHTNPCQSPPIYGCTDSTAYNYNTNANTDDGSCITSCAIPTNLQLQTAFDTRAWVQWDEMSTPSDSVSFYKVLYRAVGDTTWLIKQKTYNGNQTPIVKVRLQFLSASTQYEMKIKAGYGSGCISDFSAISYFTTADECPNVGSFAVSTPSNTKAAFSWDSSNGIYSFVRIKLRIDSISSPTSADWINAGGFGVFYGTNTKNKNGLIPGETYRGQSRTWCDPNGGPYKSVGWTPLIFWTQPTSIRVEGGKVINNLAIYPNPSTDIFSVSFSSEDVQDLRVRVLNIIGEVVHAENLQQFVGEYTKAIDLATYTKAIYFLEITTNDGIINKKLILQ